MYIVKLCVDKIRVRMVSFGFNQNSAGSEGYSGEGGGGGARLMKSTKKVALMVASDDNENEDDKTLFMIHCIFP